jgi:hypothetical protein
MFFRLGIGIKKTGLDISINETGVASTSRGLVGDTVFAAIPNVKPIHTFIITLAFQFVRKISVDASRTGIVLPRSPPILCLGYLDQTLAKPNVQVVFNCADLVRLYLILVRLACTRESCFAFPCAFGVSVIIALHQSTIYKI